ncbi:MAG: helix-turn-helix transcriptional regulator [Candidatus Ancillula sp.]|jgi:putative transcriptional regulator|nr:helix-turn-helix transcriptional regulator [Candidatus Ancillula sp.]
MKTKIKAMRKELKVSQEELAESVDVSRQTIISIENGRYIASLPLAFRIARFFKTTIEEIFIYNEEEDE